MATAGSSVLRIISAMLVGGGTAPVGLIDVKIVDGDALAFCGLGGSCFQGLASRSSMYDVR